MKLFKLVLLVALMITVSTQCIVAQSMTTKYKPLKVNEGRKLISLKQSMLHDVYLAKLVKYFDIKQYDVAGNMLLDGLLIWLLIRNFLVKKKRKFVLSKGRSHWVHFGDYL